MGNIAQPVVDKNIRSVWQGLLAAQSNALKPFGV
jgi:hypothetical protein